MMSLQQMPTRRYALRLGFATLAISLASIASHAESPPPIVVWKDPNCGCCGKWIDHLRKAGFAVSVIDTADMAEIKKARNIPDDLQACHTATVGSYTVEGHVPASDIQRLIAEQPQAQGLAVAGMPLSSPGMDQPGPPYSVILFGTPAGNRIYARH